MGRVIEYKFLAFIREDRDIECGRVIKYTRILAFIRDLGGL